MSAIVNELTRSGASSAAELYRRVKTEVGSESTFQRGLKATPNILVFGAASLRGYALRRLELEPIPLRLRTEDGRDLLLGTLVALEASQWAFVAEGADRRLLPSWLCFGQLSDALPVYQGLPWFMESFRPAGFLGRAWVNQHAQANGWPVDADSWSDDQVLRAALQTPWDWRGNLSIGPFPKAPLDLIPIVGRLDEYSKRALQVLNGEPAGSFADGEQPKFTATLDEGHNHRSVLVKFSPRMAEGPVARRWGDMLVTEAIAAQTL